MVTNNGVEGYNNRMKHVMGGVKHPFASWVQRITKEIEYQTYRHYAISHSLTNTRKYKEADPFKRQVDLLYGEQAVKMMQKVPKKKGARFVADIANLLFEENVDRLDENLEEDEAFDV